MDPNTALANARQAADDYDEASSLGMEADAAERLIEAFRALDEWLSKDGFLPADWQAEEDKPAPPAKDVDQFRRYQMYTPAGNKAVGEMVERVFANARRIGASKVAVIAGMQAGVRDVERTHPEIRDTEPRGAIYDALDHYFETEGWDRIEDGFL